MKTTEEVLATITALHRDDLGAWIEAKWIRPEWQEGRQVFADVDVARIRLISDIHHGLGIEQESISVVLSLLDQLYAARRQIGALEQALATQPADTRDEIHERYRQVMENEG